MNDIVDRLKKDYPSISFKKGDVFCWSPANRQIIYNKELTLTPEAQWSLLHELSHALLDHTNYESDIELIELESKAWDKAKELATEYGIRIDENHIQDCMDTYRDWLHQRSACPRCDTRSLQEDSKTYQCHNCGQTWGVSSSRFCRPYRLKKQTHKKSPREKTPKATFV